jgi:hypothetical protein
VRWRIGIAAILVGIVLLGYGILGVVDWAIWAGDVCLLVALVLASPPRRSTDPSLDTITAHQRAERHWLSRKAQRRRRS